MDDANMTQQPTVFDTLSVVDMAEHIKAVQGHRYIAWSDAWNTVKKHFPLSRYEVAENSEGLPYFASSMGIFVKVTVWIGEEEPQSITYPVLNSANRALKEEPYSYMVKAGERFVDGCTSFDINSSIMRALTKCLALKGLALYVYRDELQPEPEVVDSRQLAEVVDAIKRKNLSLQDVTRLWNMSKIAQLQAGNFDEMMRWIESQ